jgi:hypothetical protein
MTTNTTKLAEAIGLLSTVLSSEIAQINNPFEVTLDDVETVALDDYNDLKDIADAFNEEVSNSLDSIRGEISNCLEWEAGDPLDQDFDEKMWDVDKEVSTDEGNLDESPEDSAQYVWQSDSTKTAPKTRQAEMISSMTAIMDALESTNEKLKATLESVAESVNDLYAQNETFEQELGAY